MIRILKLTVVIMLLTTSFGCVTLKNEVMPTTPLINKEFGVAVISPNGSTIVFSLKSKDGSHLYKVNVDGTGIISITSGTTWDYDPAFSPDGTKILYCQVSKVQESSGKGVYAGDLCMMNLDGSDKRYITSGPEHDFEPIWSPDGTRIYFLRSPIFTRYSPIAPAAWHAIDIYSINPDGTDLKRITKENQYSMINLSINSQGNSLMVCTYNPEEEPMEIIPIDNPADKKIVRPNLEKYRRKTNFGRSKVKVDYKEVRNARFSPDGKHIIFTWPFFDELYVMDLETNVAEMIWKWESKDKRAVSKMYPRFSCDGQVIIFSTAREMKYTFNEIMSRPWGFDRLRDTWEKPELWMVNKDGTKLRSIK